MKLRVEAVIFDMDGVITDTMPYHFRAWKQIFATQGVNVCHEDIYKREGQKGIDSVREIFLENGKAFTEALACQILFDKEQIFKEIFKQKFITGSRSFIKFLKRQGFQLALVTGTSRHEAVRLLPAELLQCFDVSICGCEVAQGKPHPEPYLKALEKLRLNAPQDAIVFENAPFGIRSAKAAGLKCFALETSLPKIHLQQADAVFHSYQELHSKVQFIK